MLSILQTPEVLRKTKKTGLLNDISIFGSCRLGLAGGGTDVPPFVDNYGGEVVNVAINLGVNISLKVTRDDFILFQSSDNIEIYEIGSSLDTSGPLAILKETYLYFYKNYPMSDNIKKGLIIKCDQNIPYGSGLGSSSAQTVATVKCFYQLCNIKYTSKQIIDTAIFIERHLIQMKGGYQDYFPAEFRGFNHIIFNGEQHIRNNILPNESFLKKFNQNIIIAFSGRRRNSSDIIKKQIELADKENKKVINHLHFIKNCAKEMKAAIESSNFEQFTDIIKEGWIKKKELSSAIFPSEYEILIDDLSNYGLKAVKISGAGGGGFFMFIINPNSKKILLKKIIAYGFFPHQFKVKL